MGRGRNTAYPKGRQTDATALAHLAEVLGPGDWRRRDRLIEALHRVNDAHGHLPARLLVALAEHMRLSMAEVHETATFYAHFRVVEDDEPPPPATTVRVCSGPACRMAGANALPADEKVPCLGRCDHAPAATVVRAGGGFALVDAATPEALRRVAASLPASPPPAPSSRLSETDYRLWRRCLAGECSPELVIEAIEAAGLRGLGGAGFPTARKWRTVRAQPGPRLLAVNADEGEPGTFKDRHLLLTAPHRVLEGLLVAAWAVGADEAYIYLRDEYPDIRQMLEVELAALAASGLAGGLPIHLRRGAGAYVCGEESAMIESLEGKRGLPRNRPPLVAEHGLFGRPTLVNNVETLWWVPELAGDEGGGRRGMRFYSVSGRVREPGVKLAPAGITLADLIDEHCGGMAEGHHLRAFLPGGASGGIFPATMAGLPLDFGSFEPLGGFIGSAAVTVLSQSDDLKALAADLMDFFAHESCGQCTPCRIGTAKAARLLRAETWDEELLEELGEVMRDGSICGLGQAAPNVWRTLFRHFGAEVRP